MYSRWRTHVRGEAVRGEELVVLELDDGLAAKHVEGEHVHRLHAAGELRCPLQRLVHRLARVELRTRMSARVQARAQVTRTITAAAATATPEGVLHELPQE